MRTSVLARANRAIPKALPKKSVDTVRSTPAQISMAKHHTMVLAPGVVTMPDIFSPGARKLLTAALGDVLVAGLAELKAPKSWALLENTGDGWTCLYLGDGAVRSNKSELTE